VKKIKELQDYRDVARQSFASTTIDASPEPEPNPGKSVNLLTSQQLTEKKPVKKLAKSADMVMIGFRVTPREKKEIARLALTLDTSVRDLMMRALDAFKKEKGIR